MKKVVSLFMVLFLCVGFITPSFAECDIDAVYEYEENGTIWKEIYVSHKTLHKVLKRNSVSRNWATIGGAALGKVPSIGIFLTIGYASAIALLATWDAAMEEMDEGLGIIIKMVFCDVDTGWCVNSIHPQKPYGCLSVEEFYNYD